MGGRNAKSYQDVVDTFNDYGFKEDKVSLYSNGGIYYFDLNGESFDMFFQYDNGKNKATTDRLYYPADKEGI